MTTHEKINYVEFPATDLPATKAFFAAVFDWQFEDFGPDYVAFSNAGLDGGVFRSEQPPATSTDGALIVFYSESLEGTLAKVEASGGRVVKSIFEFPGGRRFHFTEPSGNELAVWSDQ